MLTSRDLLDLESKILKEWGRNQVLNFGTSDSEGAAIHFRTKFDTVKSHKSEDSKI